MEDALVLKMLLKAESLPCQTGEFCVHFDSTPIAAWELGITRTGAEPIEKKSAEGLNLIALTN